MTGLDFFVLGVLTAAFLVLVVGLFKAWKYIRDLKNSDVQTKINLQIIDRTFALHERDVDERFKRICDDYHIKLERKQKEIKDQIDELYRYVDSRFDKFENRIKEELSK